MSQHAAFRMDSHAACRDVIAANPFATLITQATAGGWQVDHLPMLGCPPAGEGGRETLIGHVARANPLVSAMQARERMDDVLAIFHGPQAYISPSWYPAKREHGRVVPTWNYQVVHVRGRLRLIEEEGWLLDMLGALTDHLEGQREAPWRVSDAPEDYITAMCRAIVGVEVTIERLEGKHKASQHKSLAERQSIFQGLCDEPSDVTARAACLSGWS